MAALNPHTLLALEVAALNLAVLLSWCFCASVFL